MEKPMISKKAICPSCDGARTIDNQPCVDCNGTGEVEIFTQQGNGKPWKNQ